MKKLFFFLTAALMSSAMINATDIWTPSEGTDKYVVTWGTTLTIPAEQFQTAVSGNLLKLSLVEATDIIEIKANGQKLPGTRFSNINEATTYELFMTQACVDSCKQYGMELCGASFGVTKVELLDGRAADIKADVITIWTGYFWVDNWCTLELFKEALTAEDLTKYEALRIYHEGPADGYIINLKANWDEAGNIANIGPGAPEASNALQYKSKNGANYVELDLDKVNPLTVINNVSSDRLMIQGNKEAGAAFNMTDIVLVPKTGIGASIVEVVDQSKMEGIFDIMGHRLESIETNGLYIVNGKKVLVNNK